jgi:hypothetical protein
MGISSTSEACFWRPRERRVLLVAAAVMLSKQQRQGKRGNILLAMRRQAPTAFEFHPAKFRERIRPVSRPAAGGGMADKS